MTPRFSFGPPPPPPIGAEVIERATGLRIDVWKDKDGDCHGDVKVTCSFGAFGKETILDERDHEEKQREAMRFIRELLAAFERKGGGDPGDGHTAAAGSG